MSAEKRDFNKDAATWDENPGRVKVAGDIVAALLRQVQLTSDMDVLEFGCGTGLVGLQLAGKARSITGVDSSPGMIDVLSGKIRTLGIKNVSAQHLDIDAGEEIAGKYHLIVSSMALHHIRDTAALLERFHRALLPGGIICIADLDTEDGSFHGDAAGIFHRGFDRARLRDLFEATGFSDVRDMTAATIKKPVSSGETQEFRVFIMSGRKRP